MNRLKEFYKLISMKNNGNFKIAARYHFFLSMNFGETVFNYDRRLFDISRIGYIVQSINLPNLQAKSGEYMAHDVVSTDVGTYSFPKLNTRMIPEVDQNLVISMLDTELPVFEGFFVHWLQKVADYRSSTNSVNGGSANFPRANIIIELFDNMNEKITFEYTVVGAFPVFVSTPDLGYSGKGNVPVRDVRFAYNDLKLDVKWVEKNASAENLLANESLKSILGTTTFTNNAQSQNTIYRPNQYLTVETGAGL